MLDAAKKHLVVAILISLSILVRFAHAESEGPLSPSSADGNNWVDPFNVYSSDDLRSSYNNSNMDSLLATGFGFSDVSGTVLGIEIEIEGYGTGSKPPDGDQIDVCLTKNGKTPAGLWLTAVTLPNGISHESYISCGGPSELWGTTWIPAEIVTPDFGALIKDTDSTPQTLYIDHVRITVYYSTGSRNTRRSVIQKFLIGD